MGDGTGGRLRRPGGLPPGLLPVAVAAARPRSRPGVQPARPGGDHPARRAAGGGERPSEAIGLNSGMARSAREAGELTMAGRCGCSSPSPAEGCPPADRHPGQMGKVGSRRRDEEVSPGSRCTWSAVSAPSRSSLIGSDAPLIPTTAAVNFEDLARVMWAAASQGHQLSLEEPSAFVICPEHADVPRRGMDQTAAAPLPCSTCGPAAGELRRGGDHPVRPARRTPPRRCPGVAEAIVDRGGGEAGRYSAVLGPCTGMGSQIVSREVGSPWPLTT
jgi:hypothetical protein